jgi:uracil-DNA glycosylase family 4
MVYHLPKGQICEGCPRFDNLRCALASPGGKIQVLFVGEQPDPISIDKNQAFSGHGGRIVHTAMRAVMQANTGYRGITTAFTYAVQCMSTDDSAPDKATLMKCNPNLNSIIQRIQPSVLVVMGSAALKQLGFRQMFSDVQHKFLKHYLYTMPVYVTFSEKALVAAPGVFETFKMNLCNIFDRVLEKHLVRPTLDQISANYRTPKTIDDAIAVCQEILNYTEDPLPLELWPLSVDTETNTLYPEKSTSKIIAFCFGWGTRKATTILYDHPHAGEEYLARLPELWEWIKKILQCRKPKIFHNAKFDLKFIELRYNTPVTSVVWDTLLGEHLLDEDKKGNYGLKVLTANLLPDYCGYEDKLYDMLEGSENVSKSEEAQKEINDLTPIISEEHPEFLIALSDYQAGLAQYESTLEERRAQEKQYKFALEDYLFQKGHYVGRVAAWQVDSVGKKPTKWFKKPAKPETIKEPKKPKDPRTKKEQQISRDAGFENIPIHELQVYGAVDADVTRQLTGIQKRRIQAEQSKVTGLMKTHAIPASRVLGRMEYYGMRVDQNYIEVLEDALGKIVSKTEQEIYAMAGTLTPSGKPMNLNGAATLANVLYTWGWTHPDGTRMDPYPVNAFTKKGQPSTSEKILRAFVAYEDDKKEMPTKEAFFVERMLQHRKASKAKNTFLANIRALSKRDGYLHTQFHLNGTGTGRLSSSDMNMQNVPKFLAGWNIKKLFIPDSDDFLIVNVDYKGAEVRVFTAYARDEALIKALNEGMDMHSFFAAKVFNRPYETYANRNNAQLFPDKNLRKLLDDERSQIKRVVFGILYGAGPEKIAETIGITVERSTALIEMLYRMFPDIKRYAEQVEFEVDRFKFVETKFGRRRRFPLAGISRHRGRAHRQGRNFKIQSTSSDIVIGQLVEMDEPLRHDFAGARMLLTVHDSIVFQYPKRYLSQLEAFVTHYAEKRVREKYAWLPVPFTADIEVGHNYGECQSIDKYMAQYPVQVAPEGVLEEHELLTELRNAAFEAA